MSDQLAAVLRAAPDGGDEPPWDSLGPGSIALPLAMLDTVDPRLVWDGAALLVEGQRFAPVHVDWLHRCLFCQPIGG
jgi:hypothetical protein